MRAKETGTMAIHEFDEAASQVNLSMALYLCADTRFPGDWTEEFGLDRRRTGFPQTHESDSTRIIDNHA